MKKAQTILSATIVIALFAVAAFFVGIRISGMASFVVTGGSMDPAIPLGSLTVVQPVTAADLKLGDVITFQHDTENVTHRIIAIDISTESQLVFTTKGDANPSADRDKLTFGGAVGLVRWHVPAAGFALAWAQSIWREALTSFAGLAFLGCAWQIIFGREPNTRRAAGPSRRGRPEVRVNAEDAWAQHMSWLRAVTRDRIVA